MPTAIWTDAIETGFSEIDSQHRCLFSLMEEIDGELEHHAAPAEVGRRFRQLLEFTDLHFATEERLMREHGYAELEPHRSAHHLLQERITEAMTRHLDGFDLHKELMAILATWLVDHIRSQDLPMAKWMQTLSSRNHPPSHLQQESRP